MSNIFSEFLLKQGLYEKQEINKDNINDLIQLINGDIKIDCYCNECGEKRIFFCEPIIYYYEYEGEYCERSLSEQLECIQNMYKIRNTPDLDKKNDDEKMWRWNTWGLEDITRVLVFKFKCSLDENHHLDYVVLANDHEMTKIGQFPTVADLSFPELKKFRKTLDTEDMREFKRAIGLFAQGIGIGAYVYLRRILERLINMAGIRAITDGYIMQEDYDNKKVVERIKMLHSYLPSFLVTNKTIYGIVSKGIHELSEEDCISYFPVVQACIIMILEQWEEEREKKEAEKKLTLAISNINGSITNFVGFRISDVILPAHIKQL